MQLIQTVTVGSGGAANIEFTSIPQTFTDLVLKLSLRSNRSSQNDYAGIRPNNLTTNQTLRILYGTGSGAGSTTDTVIWSIVNGNSSTSNTFSNCEIYIPNYAASVAKSFSIESTNENNATDVLMGITAALWNSTSAITSLTIVPIAGGSAWLQYSSASLYGITKGSDGIVTVS